MWIRISACAIGLFWLTAAQAQDSSRIRLDPKGFGLSAPAGAVRDNEASTEATLRRGNAVATTDQDGKPVVGKLVANLAAYRIVMLPDGQLATRGFTDSPSTERPFVPATRKEIASRMREAFPEFNVKETKHYVYVFNCSSNFALVTTRILESMIPGLEKFAKNAGVKTQPLSLPLVAIMFRTEAEFRQFGRLPSGVEAFYDVLSNRIVMYEESPLFRVKPELAIQNSISTIAHEGAHQILHNLGVQQRLSRWPMWLSEGLAEYLAPTSFGRDLRWKGAGEINDLRMFELEQYLHARDADTPDNQMIDLTVSAARLTSTGYASSWALTHYLARNRTADFQRYLRHVSELGALEAEGRIIPPGVIPDQLRTFQEYFGEQTGELHDKLLTHLTKVPYRDPFSDWPHWVATVSFPEGRKQNRSALMFHSPALASKWLRETIDSIPEGRRNETRYDVREFPNRPLADDFRRQFVRGK